MSLLISGCRILGPAPNMSIKVGCISHDMRIWGRIVGVRSTEQSVGIIVGGPNIIQIDIWRQNMNTDRMNPGILIFAGTTEGRTLAEYASAHSVRCFVSVATDYGKSLLEKLDNITILTGRMDEKEMECFIEENDIRLVIDATHPFAREVTENIKAACGKTAEKSEVRYVRCVRPFENRPVSGQRTPMPETESLDGEKEVQDGQIVYMNSVQDAVEYLKKTTGNILIATGSKELHLYTEIENYRERCFARVLSTEPAVRECVRLGFEGRHLFAMQGPFAQDLNLALLRQTKAVYFVTKETGKAGGFEEKAEAAERAGAVLVVIGRPEETGESVEAVKEMVRLYGREQKNEG